jgi:hypothetical protein
MPSHQAFQLWQTAYRFNDIIRINWDQVLMHESPGFWSIRDEGGACSALFRYANERVWILDML